MTNRRHSREPKPALAPIAAEPARLEPRPFTASDRPLTPDLQPHVAPAGVGHDFGQVQAPVAPLLIQAKLMAGTGGEQHERVAEPEAAQASQVHQAIQAKSLTAGPSADDRAPRADDKRGKRHPASAKRRSNQTGLPDQLKSGIEALSGMSMDGVNVHYGSSQPAQLNALAYAQGSDIHIAPGQEQHLPHEAWHVVQQAQGRVKPTMQMKEGVPANDDTGLEHEADVMGSRALTSASGPAQLDRESAHLPPQAQDTAPVQLKKLVTMGGTFDTGQYEAVTGPIEVKVGKHTQDVGGVIDMSFTSNTDVTGSFGIVQTGKAIRNKQPDYNKERTELKERMQDEHGSDPGRFLDRSKFKENPVFGLQNQKELLGTMEGGVGAAFVDNRNLIAQSGGEATIVKESVEENHNISDVAGKVGSRTSAIVATPASMRDEPTRTRQLVDDETTGDAIRMEFETAALVLNGEMEGTYLGSVQWGFEIGEADKRAAPLPFEIVSMGTPTPAFMESANAWNDQAIVSTGGGNTTQSLPLHVTNHAPDLELQKLIADESAGKEEKIEALQARIALLTRAQEAMDPAEMVKLKQAVADATLKFTQAKLAIDAVKEQRLATRRTVDPLEKERQEAGKKKDAGQKTLDTATSNLDRIGNKTIFYRKRKAEDEAAVRAATAKLAELDAALVAARAAVDKANMDIAKLDQTTAGFNTSDAVMGQREARINLQNKKADLGNVSFELAHLLKNLDKLQSE